MKYKINVLEDAHIYERLSHTPDPPKRLFMRGKLPPAEYKKVTIVGSRHCSGYAREVTNEICAALAGQPVSIVSGLAYGIDSCAHEAALKHGLHTIAVLGGGLADEILYPQRHVRLAHRILDADGALLSEQEPTCPSLPWMFPARNRIMVGISDLVIIIEAREKSGTLITGRLATDYNRDLLVVPNSIHATCATGSNSLIAQGAYMYTKPTDLFQLLGFEIPDEEHYGANEKDGMSRAGKNIPSYIPTPHEQKIILSIQNMTQQNIPATTQVIIDTCLSENISVQEIIQILLNLELEGIIRRVDGVYRVV